jgi:hypothetical protein
MAEPIRQSLVDHDMSPRFAGTSTVGASPSANAETIIGTLTLANFGTPQVVGGIRLSGFAAFTVGTSGVSVQLRIRQTNVSGAIVANTGACTYVAGNLGALSLLGADAAPGAGVYVLTMQVASGAATSTVSALHLSAIII